jgi:hypothetical protein
MFMARPLDRLIGIGLIATGAIIYYYWGQRAVAANDTTRSA